MSTIETPVKIPAGTWNADRAHSRIEARVKHMGIATVQAEFTDFEAVVESGDVAALEGSLQIASIDSHDEGRDGHLKSPDFFDAETYPTSSFSVADLRDGEVTGELTLKGVTKPVEVNVSINGAGTDPWGNERVGVDITAVIDRTDFGIDWNAPVPGGGLLVDNKVKLEASFSFTKAA
jgi:polyisoprenoid-binding protein YceI